MAGGILQIVAIGIQDLYLSGDPQITFFKIVYRRHTNFAVESVIQNLSGQINFGETVTCSLSHNGDLVGKIFLYVKIPAIYKPVGSDNFIFAWARNLGYVMLQDLSLMIDDELIDRQYGEWLYIWSQLTNNQTLGIDKMTGNVPAMFDFSEKKSDYELYIPLEFWFCRNYGVSLPIVALSESDVKIIITFRRVEECYRIGPTYYLEVMEDVIPFKTGDYIYQTINGQTVYGYFVNYDYLQKRLYYTKITNQPKNFETTSNHTLINDYRIYDVQNNYYCTPKLNSRETNVTNYFIKPMLINSFLYVNYVYLDVSERIKFVKTNHEYLIEQVQFNQELNVNSSNVKQKLMLNHPCKTHYWIIQLEGITGSGTLNEHFYYGNSYFYDLKAQSILKNANLMLNGKSRFGERSYEYFNYVQPYQHHYRGPKTGINVYSFSTNPEDYQPSSSLNMGQIDQINMMMKLSHNINSNRPVRIRSYTTNYNILRIFMGLGRLAFIDDKK